MRLIIFFLLLSLHATAQVEKFTWVTVVPPLASDPKKTPDSAKFWIEYDPNDFKLKEGKLALQDYVRIRDTVQIKITTVVRDTVYLIGGADSKPIRQSGTAKQAEKEFEIPFKDIPDDYNNYQVYLHSSTGASRKLLIPEDEYVKRNGKLYVFKVKKGEKVVYWRLK